MPPRPRRITLCADDYALHEGTDRAIIDLAASGRLDAVSCMTRSPRWPAAARALRDLPGGLRIGVHLNLTEAGVSPAGDYCSPLASVLLGAAARVLPRPRIRAVIDRHLDAYELALGRPPDHVDGHRHVHQFPGILDELAAALARRYPAEARPWLRATDPPTGLRSAKARAIVATRSWRWSSTLACHGLRCNPAFIGVYDFAPDPPRYVAAIRSGLVSAPDGALMMCHPAVGPAPADDAIAPARRMEHEFLASTGWTEALSRAGCLAGTGSAGPPPREVPCG